jgi:hypothetical protein
MEISVGAKKHELYHDWGRSISRVDVGEIGRLG